MAKFNSSLFLCVSYFSVIYFRGLRSEAGTTACLYGSGNLGTKVSA